MRKVTGKKKETQNGEEDGVEVEETENGGENEADEKDDRSDEDEDDDEPLAAKLKTPKKGKAEKKAAGGGKKGKKVAKADKEAEEDGNDEDESEEEEYEVNDIVGHKYVGKKLLYLIRWKGYTEDDDTWEPKDSLSCPEIIKKYEDANDVSAKPKAGAAGGGKKRKASAKESKPKKKPKDELDEDDEDDEKEYEVQRILDVTVKKNGKREFLVHWKGWSSRFDTWEPEENLNCEELIQAFDSKLSKAKNSSVKELRIAPKSTKRFVAANNRGGTRHSKRGGARVTYFDDE